MRAQTEAALADCDAVLFLIDARAGVNAGDRHFAQLVRRSSKPVILVANKAEGSAGRDGAYEAFSLGLGDPIAISAEHGEGLSDLYDALAAVLPETAHIEAADGRTRRRRSSSAKKRTAARTIPKGRCRSPSSAGRTPASRRCSTASSAKSGC